MSNVVTWIIQAVDQFSQTYKTMNSAIADSEKKVISFNQQLNKINDTAKTLAYRVSAPIIAFGGLGINAFLDEKKALDSLIHTLDNLGDKAPLTFDEIKRSAMAIEMKSVYQMDDVINDVTHKLIRLGTIAPENLLNAQNIIVDFAAKTGSSLENATSLFSRALQDPSKGTMFFERQLGKLDPRLKELLKDLVETGKTAQAQAIILDLAAKKIGGAAEADKINRPFLRMKEAIERVATVFGENMLPSFNKFIDVIERASYAFAALSPETKAFITYALIITATLPLAAIAVIGLVTAMKLLGVAITLASGPLGVAVVTLGLIAAGLVKAYQAGGPFTNFINNTVEQLERLIGTLKEAKSFIGGLFTEEGRQEFKVGFKENFNRNLDNASFLGMSSNILGANQSQQTNANLNITVNDPTNIIKSQELKSDGPMKMNTGKSMLPGGMGLLQTGGRY